MSGVRLIDANALHAKILEENRHNYAATENVAQIILRIETAPTIKPEVRHGIITKDQLNAITLKLKEEVWRSNYIDWEASIDLVDIISSLHNLLYEAVTGELYNYAWHWTNKVGEWTDDHCFDELIGRKKKNEDL